MVKTKNQRFQGNLSQDQCVTSEVFGGERLVVPIPYSCSFLCVHIRRTGFGTSQLINVNQKREVDCGHNDSTRKWTHNWLLWMPFVHVDFVS